MFRKASHRSYTIGIDLGKAVFHLVGLNPRAGVVERHFTANPQVKLIGMEAFGGSARLGPDCRIRHFPACKCWRSANTCSL
jgi:hypothetical protein